MPESVMMRLRRTRSERGAVMVLAAVGIFPMIFLAAFAIDVSHWWDYSRNLQNRADAAALAGAAQYGNLCFGDQATNPGGSTANGDQSVIGKWAQLYSGAGVNEPAGNLPYTDAAVSAAASAASGIGTGPGTGWNVSTNGYINNTKQGSPVNSPLTLRLGSLNNYWLILNGTDYAENNGTNFSLNTGGTGATFCQSDPKLDLTDPDRANAGDPAPMVDVKVSQRRLPLFFPLISGRPTIHAHARVQLEGEAGAVSEPIAVADTGFVPCASVKLIDASTGLQVGSDIPLDKQPPVNPTDPVTWQNNAAAAVTMPANGDNLLVQPFLNDCNGNGITYDGDTGTGLLYINNHPTGTTIVNPGAPPALTSGGVFVTGGPCPSATTQYFSVGACTVTINAFVKFDPNLAQNKTFVLAYDKSWDNTNNVYTTTLIGNSNGMTQSNTDPTKWTESFTIPDTSGMHEIEIRWRQETGSVGGTACGNGNGGNPAPCTGSFGIQAELFGACNGCDQPDDSGPIIFSRISEGATTDVNSLAAGSSHNLTFTFKLSGLFAAKFGDPPTVLRFPTSGNHQTGLVDCGQGTGTNADAYTVYYGCGPQNPHFSPPLPQLFENKRDTCGTPPGPPWPNGQQDCVQTTPGTRRTNIICPLVLRVVGAPFGTTCNNNAIGTCPTNYWTLNKGKVSDIGDPRALTMIITEPEDLAAASGPQGWIQVRRFATFYITGWDASIKPQCGDNEAFPLAGKRNSQNAAVWGHWINWVDPTGTPDQTPCNLGSIQPINCVPALTR